MKNCLDSLSGIVSLSLALTLSGCAWLSPSQWFGGNERCDPDDRSGGLSAACAKESLATQERSSKRLVCMGDDTDQAWICGNNMEEVLAQLAERNPTVLAKNKTPSATDTSTDLSPSYAELYAKVLANCAVEPLCHEQDDGSIVVGDIVVPPEAPTLVEVQKAILRSLTED